MGLSVAAVALAQLNIPSDFWAAQKTPLFLAVVILSLEAGGEIARSAIALTRAERLRQYDNDIRAALSAAVAGVVEKFGSPWDEIAVYRYEVKGHWRWRRLFCVEAIRAGAPVRLTDRAIPIDHGVSGVAVSDELITFKEWETFARSAVSAGRGAWEDLDRRSRFGLEWGDLMRSERPKGIISCPTFDTNGKVEGCVTLTGPLHTFELMDSAMQTIVSDLANAFSIVGRAPRGWRSYR
jgi:hypothetical protein